MVTKRTITIKQVAREAGVSTQTVSRVLNDRPDVAPVTRQVVQDVIDRLGYQPSAIARSLIRRRSHALGVVVATLGQYGPTRRLLGIEQAADELGYTLHLSMLHQPETNNGEQLLNDLLAWQVEGVVWSVPEIGNNRTWLEEKNSQLPVPVICISEKPDGQLPAVSVDNRAGARLAVGHLLDQGYRHIGLIAGPGDWEAAYQRQLGWQDALPEADHRRRVGGDWSAASGERGFYRLLEQYPHLDAVFACNDQMALGVLQAAHQLGRRVPQELGVVGYDNSPESAYFWPALTTVRHQLIEQGKALVQELVRVIEAREESDRAVEFETAVLQPELIIRKSSTRPPAA